jgi:predicted house-cleaning noncanonical NTP pyrophosphatase (MazG superfamily)
VKDIKGENKTLEKKSIKYNKLIRDRIPEIIEAQGKKTIVEVLDSEKYKKYLDVKLVEELKEYQESGSIEELADLVEVVYAILNYMGISLKEFEEIRRAKVNKRGAFDKRLLLKEVTEL